MKFFFFFFKKKNRNHAIQVRTNRLWFWHCQFLLRWTRRRKTWDLRIVWKIFLIKMRHWTKRTHGIVNVVMRMSWPHEVRVCSCVRVFTYSEYSLVSLINSYTCHVSLEHTRARTQQVHRFGIFQIHSCYVWNDFKETRKIVTKNIQRLHLQLIIQFEVLICQSFGNVNAQKSRDVGE